MCVCVCVCFRVAVCGGHVCAEACRESVLPTKNQGDSVCGEGVWVAVCGEYACAKAGGESVFSIKKKKIREIVCV